MTTQVNLASQAATSDSAYTLLRHTLYANTIFSGLSGMAMALLPNQIETFVGGETPEIVFMLGLGLIGFAVFTFTTAREVPLNRFKVWAIFWADVLWVVATALVIVSDIFSMNTIGNLAMAGLALVVADFAFFQWLGLRRGQHRA